MGLEFKNPTIDDLTWIKEILAEEKEKINSKSALGTCYLWSERYSTQICRFENMLIKKVTNDAVGYEFPQGAKSMEDLRNAINEIVNDAKESGYKELIFTDFLDSEVKKIEKIFPGKFEFTPNRNRFEYVYKTQDLALLEGEKYHSKRNHISKFSKTFNWVYKPMVSTYKNRYLDFFKKWFECVAPTKSLESEEEHTAIKKALENYETLELSGAVIEVDNEIIACAVGEEINENVFLVHFEKALPEFKGAYSVINNEFCKILSKRYKFVNREEDLGITGLRKSKLSYHPTILLPKYNSFLKAYRNL